MEQGAGVSVPDPGPDPGRERGSDQFAAGVRIQVQLHDFDPGTEIEALRTASAGAVVSFVGIARDLSGAFAVERITLEHYPGMTQRSLENIVRKAMARWSLGGVRLIHRYGELSPGDRIVLVATASTHRDAAFDACRFIVDYLKTEAPFWKRESGGAGARWVDARDSDQRARERWET
jgi:molybdopterin synthase catalytic subunit